MQGVGPGAVLGNRYALRQRMSQGPEVERWFALDVTLKRDVTLTVVSSRHPNCAGVLDAARRAAGVEDARLVRILDVFAEKDISFIVEEAPSGSESLATILLQGPLLAVEARRVAGETAKSLEVAGQRGLHHLRLTPHDVLIAPDGAIRVSGIAVAAAIGGSDEEGPETATALRQDTVRLVSILYAALTGRWPLDEAVPGVEPARRVRRDVVAPSEIVAGIPVDLDALCCATLNEGNGPQTPKEFAGLIAPWPRERVHRAGVDPTLILRRPSPDGAPNTAAAMPVVVSATAATAMSFNVDAPEPAAEVPDHDSPSLATTGRPRVQAGSPQQSGWPAPAQPHEAGKTPFRDSHHGSDPMNRPSGLTPKDSIGPPLPLLPESTALPPSRGQSAIVMLVVAVFVAGALYVGYRGLQGLGAPSISQPRARATVTVSAPAVTRPASPAPQGAATAGGPIAILSATGFDPQGDQGESNSQAPRVYDGNPTTTWSTELYATAQFGNLKKGVGLLLDLGQPTTVHQVTINLANGPADLTVYSASSPSLAGATVIGSASAATGQVQIKAATTMPASQYIIVWFTSLASLQGQFGNSISEIALT